METNKIGHHISRQFNEELEDIRNKVLAMGGLVEQQIEFAIQAFIEGDSELAEHVIQQEKQVDDFEVAIDEECIQILALRQPTAFDLRLLIVVIKTITELERIGDLSERIANMAIHLDDIEKKYEGYHEVQHLGDLVKDMLHGALDAFARLNVDNILSITGQDDNVDREYVSIVRQLVAQMMEDTRNVKRALNILWTVRAIERIGDHAVNICEHVIYMVQGKDVRHLSPEEMERKVLGK
ncbi:MAG: phosphate signaling complex protein PhoU, partial [Gammaproteobacteria bacterium]